VRKRVERAFRLLSPFNGGRLSPQRFQLLARVVKAGHWPQHHLFCFFDRDGDGAVCVYLPTHVCAWEGDGRAFFFPVFFATRKLLRWD